MTGRGVMKRANLELNIELLLLPDLSYGQRVQVVAALEREFSQLWNAEGVPADFVGESLAMGIARVEIAAGTPPEAMGVQVARSLYQQMAGVNSSSRDSLGGNGGRSHL